MDMLGQFSLKGKVALVTGASHGIGFSMAVALAGAGAEIAFNGHSPDRLKAAEAEYAARGIHARGYLCDVTDETAVQNMVARISCRLGAGGHSGQQCGDDPAYSPVGYVRPGFSPRSRRRSDRSVYCGQSLYPGHDRKGTWQNHQHLLHDERAWPGDGLCLRRRQGRAKNAHPKHLRRVWWSQHPVQRYRPRLYCHFPNSPPA